MDYRPTSMSVDSSQFEPMLHRHIDQVVADMTTECQQSIDRLSVDTRQTVSRYIGRQMPCIHMILLCFDRYRNLYDVNRVKDLEDLLKVFTIMLFKPASKFLASSADL